MGTACCDDFCVNGFFLPCLLQFVVSAFATWSIKATLEAVVHVIGETRHVVYGKSISPPSLWEWFSFASAGHRRVWHRPSFCACADLAAYPFHTPERLWHPLVLIALQQWVSMAIKNQTFVSRSVWSAVLSAWSLICFRPSWRVLVWSSIGVQSDNVCLR